ncbi:flagellar hook-length control protein FliK [Sedimentibacter sp. MB31-C6]|uniref:flagellar hook-length control protein FliK n=1 Tax=Sedimentibacter sp. MB31-C6 TaxID=3109366 RepID=UPI002DDCCEA8|nr:flagellar hook-length control protein FliK [Sedimentibacter sp. MB36-C1]WSI04991.1 flagellar hook-length control protein FliK [Sedimentibacter sp. MB36-C1]
MEMNIANLLPNIGTTNNLNSNMQTNNSQGKFINLLAMLLQNKNMTSTNLSENSDADINMQNLLLGNDLNKHLINTERYNPVLPTVPNLQENQEDNTELQYDYSSMINMIYGADLTDLTGLTNSLQNFEISNNSVNFENIVNDIMNSDVRNKGNVANASNIVVNNDGTVINSNNSELFTNNHNLYSNEYQPDNLVQIDTKLEEKVLDPKLASELNKHKVVSEKTILKDNLVSIIETDKENFKEKINFQIEQMGISKTTYDFENKIIKVSDESSLLKSTVLTQIKDRIDLMYEEKSQHVVMELYPKNLGKVDIKMSFENEKLTVDIMALDKETQSILMTNVKELSSILENKMDTAVQISIKNDMLQYDTNNLNSNGQQSSYQRDTKSEYYYTESNNEDNDEVGLISEMMNLRNMKLNKVV